MDDEVLLEQQFRSELEGDQPIKRFKVQNEL